MGLGLTGILVVVGPPDFVVPTTEDQGLADEVALVVVDLDVGKALGVVAGLRVVALMLVEFPGQRRDPLLFFAGPQPMSRFCTDVPRSLFERLNLTAHQV